MSSQNGFPARRPCGEILVNGETKEMAEEEEELTEGSITKGQQIVVKPSEEEWENYLRTHVPYRKWCPHRVKGKRKTGAHKSVEDELKETEEVPVIPFGYMVQKTEEGKEEDIGSLPVLGIL